ncbi:tail completion protein gp17 [Rhodovulum sp. DZ06]|uniref:tail completion protein gp17 n=1 Tax=Rhodovulum sp. DZ06 TaxID=3425126 RepID=UPI003D34E928
MEAALIAALLSAPGVSALAGTRVWPLRRPQGSDLPAVTLRRISGAPLQSHDGPASLARARVQVDVWAHSYAAAKALRGAVAAVLDAAATPAGEIRAVRRLDERDLSEADGRLVRISLDFELWHQET